MLMNYGDFRYQDLNLMIFCCVFGLLWQNIIGRIGFDLLN